MFIRVMCTVCVLLSFSSVTNAQSFGFGCLGFVGGYGGFSYHQYQPEGFNDFIGNFNQIRGDSLISPMEDFGKAQGFRVGLNFFRAKVENFILTTKGYYQSLTEKHEALERIPDGTRSTTFKVELRNLAIGVDLGISLTKDISWKVVDGALHFNTVILTNTENSTGAQTIVTKFRTESTALGYSIGTGFILEIIDEYFSIEGVAGYTSLSIDNIEKDNVNLLSEDITSNKFIESGGFSAVIQLNVGFPL
jgi:hypothetical protein